MRFLPHTDEEVASMLKTVGAANLDELFSTVPDDCRYRGELNLPGPLTEWELKDHMAALSGHHGCKAFIGAGSYEHHIPETVSYLASRSEFVTAYTPYQPEVSQGTLQAIYEYQTLTARLLGMEVANASLYDGASALAEALLMAIRVTRRGRVAVSRLVHPFYRRVVQTYFAPTGYEVVELAYNEEGRTDLSDIGAQDEFAAIAVQSPNFFGIVERIDEAARKAHERGALCVIAFTEPLAYGILKSPGQLGADVACGEGQSLGIPQWFGGPGLGMFATKMDYVRNMPGRLVGQTVDAHGKRGFVLTLATREQHIRREKATSNICTNHSLCALTSAIYMASLGGSGIRKLARLNYDKAEYLKSALNRVGCTIAFPSATFNEFVVKYPNDARSTYEKLLEKKMLAGLPLDAYYPELSGQYLLCVTETKSREDMDVFVREVAR
ncbi:MAG: aminomethyl-transferring glycine dehydrogenase subunit GcvPA [Candidatus Abyssubacteria bacterium]